MLYYVSGWNIFKFIITPSEVENIFQNIHHVINNARVPDGYIESNKNIFFQNYKNMYEKLAEGYKFEWKKDWRSFDLHMSFSDDLSKCVYGKKFLDKTDGKYYMLSDFKEPPVNISPLCMTFSENKKDEKLYTVFSYTQFTEFTAGLEISYPKNISLPKQDKEDEYETFKCEEIETYKLYTSFISEIKKITKPLRFKIGDKEYKPSVRISETAKNDFRNFYFSKYYETEMIK